MNLTASFYGAVRLRPEQHLHRPGGADRGLVRRVRAELRLQLDPDPRLGPVRQRRRRPLRQRPARLRRDLRESDLRRRRHQLLDPPDHPVRRRRPRRLDQRPQRHPQLAALVEGAGPVELRQSGHDAARRRRRFRPHPAAAAVGQRQPSLVPPDRGAAGAEDAGHDPPRHRLGPFGGGDLAAERDPERRLPAFRGGARAGHRLPRPVRERAAGPANIIRSCSTRS